MIKKLFFGLVFLSIVALVAIYFLGSGFLNKLIKSGVETYGPELTQTPVTLEDVNLSILSGSGSINGLNIGNPDGYKSENIFSLGEIDIKIDTSSLLSDKIIIDYIIIKQPEISYEKTLSSSNVKELLKNIEELTGPGSDAKSETNEVDTSEGTNKKVVIRQLIIEDGSIYVAALGVGQTVDLPRIEMNDIGEDGNQVTVAQVVDLVLSQVTQSIGPAISNVGNLLEEGGKAAFEKATSAASESLESVTGDAVDKATDSLKGLFGN